MTPSQMNSIHCSHILFTGASSFLLRKMQSGIETGIRSGSEVDASPAKADPRRLRDGEQSYLHQHAGKGTIRPDHRNWTPSHQCWEFIRSHYWLGAMPSKRTEQWQSYSLKSLKKLNAWTLQRPSRTQAKPHTRADHHLLMPRSDCPSANGGLDFALLQGCLGHKILSTLSV